MTVLIGALVDLLILVLLVLLSLLDHLEIGDARPVFAEKSWPSLGEGGLGFGLLFRLLFAILLLSLHLLYWRVGQNGLPGGLNVQEELGTLVDRGRIVLRCGDRGARVLLHGAERLLVGTLGLPHLVVLSLECLLEGALKLVLLGMVLF